MLKLTGSSPHQPLHVPYVLAIIFMNSIDDNLTTLLINSIPQILAMTKPIQENIIKALLSHFNNEAIKYFITVRDNIRMITPSADANTSNNGLISYILHQLKASTVPLFQERNTIQLVNRGGFLLDPT